MIQKALEYIVGLSKAEVQEVNGSKYSDKRLTRIDEDLRAEQISLFTLNSLVDYIKSATDIVERKLLVHVVSPTEVELISELDRDRKRETLAYVTASVPKISLNNFMSQEEFIIMLQSQFVDFELNGINDKQIVLQVAGNVIDKTVADYGDDGITQKATIKTGLATNDDVKVPNPVVLVPYRSFQEIIQVPSSFVFRMRQSDRGVTCALFEADGGAWKIDAVMRVKKYLQESLEGIGRITVIA